MNKDYVYMMMKAVTIAHESKWENVEMTMVADVQRFDSKMFDINPLYNNLVELEKNNPKYMLTDNEKATREKRAKIKTKEDSITVFLGDSYVHIEHKVIAE